MTKVFYKENWQNVEDLVFNFGNRGIKYGDGFFETMTVHDGQIKFLKDHLERMERTASLLGLELSNSGFHKQLLIETIHSFSKISQYNNCSIRIQFFRLHGSRYTPSSPKVDFYIECSTLNSGTYQIGQKIESVGIFNEHLLQKNSLLESIKSSNSLHYVLAKAYAAKHDFSDVILMNTSDEIAEFSSSNLFIDLGDQIITPPLSSGCLDGIIRRQLLKPNLSGLFNIQESVIKEQDLLNAQSIYGTNTTKGIFHIIKYREKVLGPGKANKIQSMLNKL